MILLKKNIYSWNKPMRKLLIVLCLLLTVPIYNFSQTISNVTITSEQLKTANVIFAEHNKFSKEIPLLKTQVNNLKIINKSWEHTDSIRNLQITNYYSTMQDQNKSIEDLNKSLKRQRRIIGYGAAGSIIAVLLCLVVR